MIDEKDLIPLIQNEKKWITNDYYKGWNDALDAIIAIVLMYNVRKEIRNEK